METHEHSTPPPDVFTLDELQTFQSYEGEILSDVNYYFWLNQMEGETAPYRFLYFIELVFDNQSNLLLTSGEDSVCIAVSDAATLVNTAERLRQLHGHISIQRVNAGAFPIWQPAIGKVLSEVLLSKNEEGLYYNDALLLDFGMQRVLVQIGRQEGLEVYLNN